MERSKGKFWLALALVDLAAVAVIVVLLNHSAETGPAPAQPETVTVAAAPSPAATPTPILTPSLTPSSSPSITVQPRTSFQFAQYSDPSGSLSAIYPAGWTAQTILSSSSEAQVRFTGPVNENPASKAEIYVGFYRGAAYADWLKTISSLTNNYTLESKDLRNTTFAYSTFFKQVQNGFSRVYVSEVSGGTAILESTYQPSALLPGEEKLLDSTVLLIAAYLNLANPSR